MSEPQGSRTVIAFSLNKADKEAVARTIGKDSSLTVAFKERYGCNWFEVSLPPARTSGSASKEALIASMKRLGATPMDEENRVDTTGLLE
jgi:hypothetical protein